MAFPVAIITVAGDDGCAPANDAAAADGAVDGGASHADAGGPASSDLSTVIFGDPACGYAQEGQTVRIQCPANTFIKGVTFASWGTPTGYDSYPYLSNTSCSLQQSKIGTCDNPNTGTIKPYATE